MNTTKFSTLVTTFKIMRKHNKLWATPTQRTLLNLLEKYHKIKIGRRALNYHLADLRKEGLIHTIRRYKRNTDGTICLRSSAHSITIKGYRFLLTMGIREAYFRLKQLVETYLPDKLPKLTGEKHLETQERPTPKTGKNPFLDPAFRKKKGMREIVPFAV